MGAGATAPVSLDRPFGEVVLAGRWCEVRFAGSVAPGQHALRSNCSVVTPTRDAVQRGVLLCLCACVAGAGATQVWLRCMQCVAFNNRYLSAGASWHVGVVGGWPWCRAVTASACTGPRNHDRAGAAQHSGCHPGPSRLRWYQHISGDPTRHGAMCSKLCWRRGASACVCACVYHGTLLWHWGGGLSTFQQLQTHPARLSCPPLAGCSLRRQRL
jgi:hypothetical protein